MFRNVSHMCDYDYVSVEEKWKKIETLDLNT